VPEKAPSSCPFGKLALGLPGSRATGPPG
jgi:hypothetical protein